MGGVDRNDGMIGTYSSVRKSMKWTKNVAFQKMLCCLHFVKKEWWEKATFAIQNGFHYMAIFFQ